MTVGWVCWESRRGLTQAHYVGSPGSAPVCGWRGEVAGVPAGKRADDRIAAPADSTRCHACTSAMLASDAPAS